MDATAATWTLLLLEYYVTDSMDHQLQYVSGKNIVLSFGAF